MSLLRSISDSPALLVAGAVAGVLLGPAAAAASVTVPDGRWPWWLGSRRWPRGEPASRRRIGLMMLGCAVVLGTLASAIDPRPATLAFLTLGLLGVILTAIDLEHHRLPDRLTVSGFVACSLWLIADAVVSGSTAALLRGLLCAVVASAAFLLMALISPQGMGMGDVKLAGLLSLLTGWLSWQLAVLALLGGFLLGAGAALVLLVTRRVGLRTAIPFGPSLLVATWLAVLAAGPLG